MPRTPIIWTLLAGLGLSGAPLGAEPRQQLPVSAVELTEDGLPVIRVALHAPNHPGRTRSYRFLVSTAQENTIIDHCVPPEFYWDEPGIFSFQDATGAAHPLPTVLVKRVEVAGLVRDGVTAVRVDLKRVGSPDLDDPVDGILGMSFLRGTRFVYDPGAKRICWWQDAAPGETLPIAYLSNHVPLVTLRVGTAAVPALIDLGRMGGVELPWSLKPAGKGAPVHSQGMLGPAAPGQFHEMGRVEAGAGAWICISASFREGMEGGGIGQDVWSVAPACFDFIRDRLTLRVDSAGRLPIQDHSSLTIPVFWDRTGSTPRLVVAAVRPGSPMAMAGCRPGDELVRAGNLSGPALNRRSLMALLARRETHVWTVQRDGKSERLLLFGPTQKP